MYEKNYSYAFWNCCSHKETRRSTRTKYTRSLRTRAAKCIEDDGGIFEYVIVNCNKSSISVQQKRYLNTKLKLKHN
jgi:hypothetical protein